MTETKFTPGPWAIEENLGTDERYCDWHSIGPVELPGGKADANSHLIAAAPELYALAEAFADDNISDAEFNRMRRAALAKARGEAV